MGQFAGNLCGMDLSQHVPVMELCAGLTKHNQLSIITCVEYDDVRRQELIPVSGLHRLRTHLLEDCHYLLTYIVGRIFA
jgi:hypothetical protein